MNRKRFVGVFTAVVLILTVNATAAEVKFLRTPHVSNEGQIASCSSWSERLRSKTTTGARPSSRRSRYFSPAQVQSPSSPRGEASVRTDHAHTRFHRGRTCPRANLRLPTGGFLLLLYKSGKEASLDGLLTINAPLAQPLVPMKLTALE